ncbi:MAG: protein tyrosine phosphatase family protein [Pseudomonadota bacterium]
MTDLPHILNFRRLDDRITLSGQPTEEQLAELAKTGVTHIINLGPHTNNGALPDEPGAVSNLGMEYIYIPVDFEAPTDDDFDQFCSALENLLTQRIHVHCIYNARVTAFFYRYAKSGLSPLDTAAAFDMMDGIWRPGDDWAKFIDHPPAKDQPNRFKGYEY